MLWSQQVELEEEARLHSSNLMPNKMMTLYYDPIDQSKPVKATQYPTISGSHTFKQVTQANPSHQELAPSFFFFQIRKLWWLPTPHPFLQNQDIGKMI